MQGHVGNMSFETKIALSAAIGGTAEALGGGKFANGAITGAYVMMFNHLGQHGGSGDEPTEKDGGYVKDRNTGHRSVRTTSVYKPFF